MTKKARRRWDKTQQANLERELLKQANRDPGSFEGSDVLVAAEVAAGGGELWTHNKHDYMRLVDGNWVAKPEISNGVDSGGLGVKLAAESWETMR